MDDKAKAGVEKVAQKLYEAAGQVTASELVNAAKPKSSPAHAGFEWDDSVAGHEYRLNQARRWLRLVVVRTGQEEPERYVHVPVKASRDEDAPREGVYKPLSIVQSNPDEFARARDEVLKMGRAFAKALQELDAISATSGKTDITAVIAQISRGLDLFERAIETMH